MYHRFFRPIIYNKNSIFFFIKHKDIISKYERRNQLKERIFSPYQLRRPYISFFAPCSSLLQTKGTWQFRAKRTKTTTPGKRSTMAARRAAGEKLYFKSPRGRVSQPLSPCSHCSIFLWAIFIETTTSAGRFYARRRFEESEYIFRN